MMTEEEIDKEVANFFHPNSTVSKSLSIKRLAICETCYRFQKTLRICKECTCFMPFKTRMDYVDCPLGKWYGSVDGEFTRQKSQRINDY